MSRRWIPVGVVACCIALAIVIAGWPDQHEDQPLAVRSVPTTAAPAVTTVATLVATSVPATSVPATFVPATSVPATATAPATAAAGRPPAGVHVIAFNASAVPGSAGRVSARLKTDGYSVGPAGPDKKPARDSSAVMYRPGFDTEARTLAVALGLDPGVIQPAEAAPGGWGNAEVAVVIGNDVARRA